ncbi:MAG: tRNA (guanosine(37)-N1)-methyltransferase TrmD [Pseudomonadota bacterium]
MSGPSDPEAPRSHGLRQPVVSAQPRPLMEDRRRPGAFAATVLTLFPAMFPGALGVSLTGKALDQGLWTLEALDIRRFARDKHRTVDDTPAGGGPGMVMRADVVAAALDFAVRSGPGRVEGRPILCLSPRGQPFDQARARALADGPGAVLLCGRFEGIDQRVLEARGVEELSIGDFVLSGGEIAAMAVLDAVLRLRPGVLGNAESPEDESFSRGLLEHPHYTRPQVWEGRPIPETLLSGHHGRIAEWRLSQAERLTQARRPDLWRAHLATRDGTEGDRELSGTKTSAANGGHDED